ncbi:MAG: hypothetical protein CSA62_04895 [Planctomycetota bacterium]|nr:MAG: hypothetical protein CSA62_04895 [Planctomycetota bacterium]
MSFDAVVSIDPFAGEGAELDALFVGESFLDLRYLRDSGCTELPGRELWVLRLDGRLAGVLILDLEPGGRTVELSLGIGPGERRRGLAVRLLHTARERALALGARELRALVQARNEAALGFFSARGFEGDPAAPKGYRAFRLDLG